MKISIPIISGAVIFAGVFALAAPALADGRDRHHRREYRQDLRGAHRELRRDLHRGAGRGEIARDRATIARERRELRQRRHGWDDRQTWTGYGRYRHDDDRHRRWNRGNRWDRRDRGWNQGWWR